MRFGLSFPAFGPYSEVEALVELAQVAEAAGWDGFFLWDHVLFHPAGVPLAEPWTALTAVALRTQQLRLGPMVTPLARRRPWQVARQAVTLDRLSGGRLVLGVGLGDPAEWDYGTFGEEVDAKVRAAKLDEGLAILDGLWQERPFAFAGEHYHLQEMTFRPGPLQQPRIPVWVGGWWPNKPPLRRAARWDGVFPGRWGSELTLNEWRQIMDYVRRHRTADGPFDWVHAGATPGDDAAAAAASAAAHVTPYAELDITWWIEPVDPWRFGLPWDAPITPEAMAPVEERVRQGPPRLG